MQEFTINAPEAARHWPAIERGMRDALGTTPLPPAAIDWIVADVRPRIEPLYLTADITFSVPDSMTVPQLDGLLDQAKALADATFWAALVQLVELEAALWLAMNPPDPRSPKVVGIDTVRRHLAEAGATNTSPRRVA